MTSTTPFEEPTVAAEANAAEREAREAAALATRLEQRVANGDDTITAVELEEQQRAASWAALRAKGARARSARATRKQAEEAARASIESAAQALGNDEALIDAWEAATLALARLQTLATDRSRALAEHVGQLEQHHDTLVGRPATFGNHGGQLGGATFGLKSGLGHRFSLSIPDRGVSAVDVSADRLVESAIAVAAGRPDAAQTMRGLKELLPELTAAAERVDVRLKVPATETAPGGPYRITFPDGPLVHVFGQDKATCWVINGVAYTMSGAARAYADRLPGASWEVVDEIPQAYVDAVAELMSLPAAGAADRPDKIAERAAAAGITNA